jgi:hypothetical protein
MRAEVARLLLKSVATRLAELDMDQAAATGAAERAAKRLELVQDALQRIMRCGLAFAYSGSFRCPSCHEEHGLGEKQHTRRMWPWLLEFEASAERSMRDLVKYVDDSRQVCITADLRQQIAAPTGGMAASSSSAAAASSSVAAVAAVAAAAAVDLVDGIGSEVLVDGIGSGSGSEDEVTLSREARRLVSMSI